MGYFKNTTIVVSNSITIKFGVLIELNKFFPK